MLTVEQEEENFWKEMELITKKYETILFEINKILRKELRSVGVRKNVVPTKYILPKDYITQLLEYPLFRRVWQRKVLWRYLKRDDEKEGKWIKIQSFPNIGGVEVEEGSQLKVILERIPRRKRQRK